MVSLIIPYACGRQAYSGDTSDVITASKARKHTSCSLFRQSTHLAAAAATAAVINVADTVGRSTYFSVPPPTLPAGAKG